MTITEKQIPKDRCVDNTCTLLKEGYLFIQNRTKRYGSDLFETRLLGKRVICMSGQEAAGLFYNTKLFKRKGALPKRVQKTLFGVRAIQTMDGAKHQHRKHFFQSVMTKEYQEQLVEIAEKKWKSAAGRWESMGQIVLFDEVNDILCQAVCEWAQVPLQPGQEKCRARDFSAMVSDFGAVGVKYWSGKAARKRTEKWIKGLIEDTRRDILKPEKNSVLYKTAFYREDGRLLDSKMAAVELINILRPVTAVSRFITFMALALQEHGEYREKLLSKDEKFREMFVQEVRRYYPFAPCLGAVVKKNFKWRGYKFRKGTLVLLDIYGTNHDFCRWKNPNTFWPERFEDKGVHVFDFIPQGGGNVSKGHRCPGEQITIELMKASLEFLLSKIEYKVPVQNLNYSLKKIPSLPESGFVMSNIFVQN